MKNSRCWCNSKNPFSCSGRSPETMEQCYCSCHTLNFVTTRFDEKFFDMAVAGYSIGTEEISLENGQLIIDLIVKIIDEKENLK